MADAGAVFTRSMCAKIFSTVITDSIRIAIIMTCCRDNLLFYKHCVTYGAVRAFGKTSFGTGRSNRLVNNDCMALCRTFICQGVRHVTTVALCGLGAVGCAGCITIGNVVCEAVTESIDSGLCYKDFAADRAVLAFGKTSCCAGRCNGKINNLNMTRSIATVTF